MPDVSEQEPSNNIEKLKKALHNGEGKTKRNGKTGTTPT